jgi:ribosomal protein S18 acetylase RimI-like enzyme
MPEQLNFRLATSNGDDLDVMRSLIFTHGANDWNYLPEDEVAQEFEDVRSGRAIAVLAEDRGEIIGFAVSYPSLIRFPELSDSTEQSSFAYICDVVVNRKHAGKGVGAKMLTKSQIELVARGAKTIFIDCHEENLASRGMMRKSGFVEVAVVDDPERRFVGSRRTVVSAWNAASGV